MPLFAFEDVKEALIDGAGVAAGVFVSGYVGDRVSEMAGVTDPKAAAAVKAGIGAAIGFLGIILSGMTSGIVSSLLFMFGVGGFASAFLSLIGLATAYLAPPTTKMVRKMNASERVITVKSEPLVEGI